MTLLDANILLNAYDKRSAQNIRAREWLERLLSGKETVGLPWVTAWAFVRISTNPRLNEHPLRAEEVLLEQMRCTQVKGRETTGAVLAPLAIEYGSTLASTDGGLRRFPDLHWVNPLA